MTRILSIPFARLATLTQDQEMKSGNKLKKSAHRIVTSALPPEIDHDMINSHCIPTGHVLGPKIKICICCIHPKSKKFSGNKLKTLKS